jgi:hypothetical protein
MRLDDLGVASSYKTTSPVGSTSSLVSALALALMRSTSR